MRVASTPRLVCSRFTSVRARSPAPASSTAVSATCETIKILRSRIFEWPTESFEPWSFSIECKSTRVARIAGASPKSTLAEMANAIAKSSTRKSSPPRRLVVPMPCAVAPTIALEHHEASRIPAAPPITPMSKLSVSSCRTKRPRPEPSAERTAVSRCRASPRASRSPARFAQVISSTSPTMLTKTSSGSSASCCKTGRPCDPPISSNGFAVNCCKSPPWSLSSFASDSRIGS